ncbi:MAG: PEGA domain-containing protein [Polyangiaceae bacterium]
MSLRVASRLGICVLALLAGTSLASRARSDEGTDARARALAEFKQGVTELDAGDPARALEYFERSRSIYPSWQNTLNCAVSLTRLGREAEAAARLQAVLDFEDLPPERRESVSAELERLLQRLGSLSLSVHPTDSTVSVNGQVVAPATFGRPLRLSPGRYEVRAFKDGFEPLRREVVVERGKLAALELRLSRLTAVASLQVSAAGGEQLQVILDGNRIGNTPWSGLVAPGTHTVQLLGKGRGTAPTSVKLYGGRQETLRLEPVAVRCRATLGARPESAEIVLDGVSLGQGGWSSELPCRDYQLEVRAADHLTQRRTLSLRAGESVVEKFTLERANVRVVDSTWEVEAKVGALAALGLGGDLQDGCDGSCSAEFPFGGRAALGATLRLPSGVGLGMDVSGVVLGMGWSQRDTDRAQDGPTPTVARLDDSATLRAVGVVPRLGYRHGRDWLLEANLGVGVWLGYLRLERAGTVNDPPERLTTKRFDSSALYGVAEPELRLSRRFGDWDFGVSASTPILLALRAPTTEGFTQRAGQVSVSYVPSEQLTGSLVWLVSSGLFLRHTF